MKTSNIASALVLGSMIALSGCGSDDDNMDTMSYSYTLKVTNLTAGQPMSPILVSSDSLFSVGESASEALEHQAEGGDNSMLLMGDAVSGTKLLTPGESESLSFTSSMSHFSLTTMLVKTNDAFAGVSGYDLSNLAVGEMSTLYTNVYDAGTEENSETNTTVPGLKGEGYNSERETLNMITLHSGVVSRDDGLVSSGLSAMEKFNNPALMITITRTK